MKINEAVINQFFYLTGEDQDPMTIFVFALDKETLEVSVLTDWEEEIYILSDEAFEDFVPATQEQVQTFVEYVRAQYKNSQDLANHLKEMKEELDSDQLQKINEQVEILIEWQVGAKILLAMNK